MDRVETLLDSRRSRFWNSHIALSGSYFKKRSLLTPCVIWFGCLTTASSSSVGKGLTALLCANGERDRRRRKSWPQLQSLVLLVMFKRNCPHQKSRLAKVSLQYNYILSADGLSLYRVTLLFSSSFFFLLRQSTKEITVFIRLLFSCFFRTLFFFGGGGRGVLFVVLLLSYKLS